MKKNGSKMVGVTGTLIVAFLVIQVIRTLYTHFLAEGYSGGSWEIVWPVIVSTMIAIFGTLVTSYVFLKDALDRKIDEKPYYGKTIKRYRQGKVNMLLWYSIMFIGVSCYLILFQNAGDSKEESILYDGFLYMGILMVVVLLLLSVLFLRQCLNIDRAIYVCACGILEDLDEEVENKWKGMKNDWETFICNYIGQREYDKDILEFLEVNEDGKQLNGRSRWKGLDEGKFVIKFSEWEKFILAFLDKSSGFQSGQEVEQRMAIAAGYIENLGIIQKIEQDDAKCHKWGYCAYATLLRYEELIEGSVDIQDFLDIYRMLSDYRDTLQVMQDNQGKTGKKFFLFKIFEKVETEKDNAVILYMLFLLRFYSSVRCLITLPKIEIFYPLAKMYHVDFYNVRFENSSLRASLFYETVFVRAKMVGCNMALGRFEKCNFYNADFRDCSLGNSIFESCLMTGMIWSNVDITGSEFKDVDLSQSTFENAILVNVEFHNGTFDYVNFIDCKLGEVDFYNIYHGSLKHSSFEKSILNDVCFNHSEAEIEIPDPYKAYAADCFVDLGVEKTDGPKKRKVCDIWKTLEEAKRIIDMSSSSFLDVVAEKIRFENMALDAAVFTRANLQGSTWRNVYMKGCIMINANLTDSKLEYNDMSSCVLKNAVLYKAKLRLINMQDSNLSDCHASECNCTEGMFDKSDMSRIDLTKSHISNSSLRDTILTEAELTNAEFRNVIFENCNGRGVLSSYSYFENCDFTNAFLSESNFNYTIFNSCNLSLAGMSGSTIEEAEFESCNFENSNFRNCIFIRVKFYENSNMSEEIFDGSTFIQCDFEGSNEMWQRVFRNNYERYKVY